jgi:hypothetical protein
MPNTCVKLWDNRWEMLGKSWGRLSTKSRFRRKQLAYPCEQPPFVPSVIQGFPRQLFTQNIVFSPLIEQKFYPVSTAPIISITN